MDLTGQLIAESPIYRGNAIKTLFTRDGDGKQKLLSLPGRIGGTAQALMDAFIGKSKNGKNIGLLNKAWKRLYGEPFPEKLIRQVNSNLQKEVYPPNGFFDLRMGMKLDEDRWAAEAEGNYKMETVFRNAVFDFGLHVDDSELRKKENQAKLFYLLKEMEEGRFWFGAGKSKGLGKLRLKMNFSHLEPQKPPELDAGANHLRLDFFFDSLNPVMVGWNWGKKDPDASGSSKTLMGSQVLNGFDVIPEAIKDRLDPYLHGPISDPNEWKRKFKEDFPEKTTIWLKEASATDKAVWSLPAKEIKKLTKGKYAVSKKIFSKVQELTKITFESKDEAEEAILAAFGKKANRAKQVIKMLEESSETRHVLNEGALRELVKTLNIDELPTENITPQLEDEDALAKSIEPQCRELFGNIYRFLDQQIDLAHSDTWIDTEIRKRKQHIEIKKRLLENRIDEIQWETPNEPPEGIHLEVWSGFLEKHKKVSFFHMKNSENLNKSITNDTNLKDFLIYYRAKTRQELSRKHHIDYRAGGEANREISRAYGKPYDKIFMRMLKWNSLKPDKSEWEIYIPGSTIKGAFRKRASQILKTLTDDQKEIRRLLGFLFGVQGKRGKVFFSDAYLADPVDHYKDWCSSDGIRMNPQTGKPFDNSKQDFLFAYGKDLKFRFGIDIKDICEKDLKGISLLWHLILDFQKGDIPIGGERNSGFGWVKADISELTWLTGNQDGITKRLFGDQEFTRNGIWQETKLHKDEILKVLKPFQPISSKPKNSTEPPEAMAGFISHRAYGGRCGTLHVEAEVLSPLSIRESGSPSYSTIINETIVNGWDFFSFSPPDSGQRKKEKIYAIPSKSIKGALRHIYSITSDSKGDSSDIASLNPVDSLFGWVGKGNNNALAGRLSITYGQFDNPEISWLTVPHFYGHWKYAKNQWQDVQGNKTTKTLLDDFWRVFLHRPLIPDVKRIDGFEPEDLNNAYFRAVMPRSKARFSVRFWNLRDEELQRIIWCIGLESSLAHKMGNRRYVGLGSIRFKIKPSSFFINWSKRYSPDAAETDWQEPIEIEKWKNEDVIAHYEDLKRVLNADRI